MSVKWYISKDNRIVEPHLSLSGALFFGNFSPCDLGMMMYELQMAVQQAVWTTEEEIEWDVTCISFMCEWPNNKEMGAPCD